MTPTNPTDSAAQRRGPTRSPSIGTDSTVMNSGAAKAMAITSASGIRSSAR